VEAFVVSAPLPGHREEAFRQCLSRNCSGRRLHFALDRHGDLLLVGRMPLSQVTEEELELVLGEVHETVEVALPPLVRAFTARENPA